MEWPAPGRLVVQRRIGFCRESPPPETRTYRVIDSRAAVDGGCADGARPGAAARLRRRRCWCASSASSSSYRLAYTTYTDAGGVVVQIAEGTLGGSGSPRITPGVVSIPGDSRGAGQLSLSPNCSRTLCGEQGPSVRPTRTQSTGRAAGPSRRGRSKRGKASRWSRCRVTLASQDSPRGRPTVQKTPLFAPFIYKMHHFTKTGSGQI